MRNTRNKIMGNIYTIDGISVKVINNKQGLGLLNTNSTELYGGYFDFKQNIFIEFKKIDEESRWNLSSMSRPFMFLRKVKLPK